MAGHYDLRKNPKGDFHFTLKAGNGETILSSQMYGTKAGAQNGIASVQVNSPVDGQYDRQVSVSGQAFFNLLAANHQIIGTSQMYSSPSARDAGIESVKVNGPLTDIRDNS